MNTTEEIHNILQGYGQICSSKLQTFQKEIQKKIKESTDKLEKFKANTCVVERSKSGFILYSSQLYGKLMKVNEEPFTSI